MTTQAYILTCIFMMLPFTSEGTSVSLKEEFDISSYWHEGMTWKEFLKIRNSLKREGLIKYVDKIEQQKMAHAAGLETPKTYIASREKVPIVDLIAGLSSYVAKATHLSLSEGLIIVKDGIHMLTGKPITPEHVQRRLFSSLKRKPRNVESWALHHVPPGYLIEEYIPQRMEVKIQTIWGKAIIGEWRGGELRSSITPIFGRYDRNGTLVDGAHKAPRWWKKAVEAAELIAKDTDALRVDFLVKKGGILLLNELEIWPESDWKSMKSTIEKELNDGYRAYCAGKK